MDFILNLLQQIGVNQTFFIQLALWIAVFLALRAIYFKPFLELHLEREEKTSSDREASNELQSKADAKEEDYRNMIAAARKDAKSKAEEYIGEAKRVETELLNTARGEVKKLNIDAAARVKAARDEAEKKLEAEVESLANLVSEKLLVRR